MSDDDVIDCTSSAAVSNESLPSFVHYEQNNARVFVTVELPVPLKQVTVKADNRQLRIVPSKTGGKALVQGVWAGDVANHTVTSDADTNTLHVELLKGSKTTWASLFRVRPASSEHELRRVVRAAAGKDGVELTLVVGQLVVLLALIDSDWAKGSVFGLGDDVGLFRLDDTEPIGGDELDDAKTEAMRVIAQMRLAESQEKQDALRQFYQKSSAAAAPTAAGALTAGGGGGGEWNEQHEIDFATDFYHAIVTNERAWSDGLQAPRGDLSGWLDKMVEKNVGGSMAAVKGFGKKLLSKMSSHGLEGWQRRFCLIDGAQMSFVYGLIANEHNLQMLRWEFKGSIFLSGCQVSVLAFQVSGRPGCVRLRPSIGAKLKDYVFAAESLAIANQWVEGLVAAGAVLVDANDNSVLEPRGVHGGVLHKLGGGVLSEWQPRHITVEAQGLLSYYEIKARAERKEYHLRGTLQLNFCNVSKHDVDTAKTPTKYRYQLTLKQQGGSKDKDYVFGFDRHDAREKWLTIFLQHGTVDLVHPNSVKPLLRVMPPLPATKRPKASTAAPAVAAAAPVAKTTAPPPKKPALTSTASAPAAAPRPKPKPMPMTSEPAPPKPETVVPPKVEAAKVEPAEVAADVVPAPLVRAASMATRPPMPTPARGKPLPQARPLPAAKSAPTTPRDEPPAAAPSAVPPTAEVGDSPSKPLPARQDLETRKAELAARKAALEARRTESATTGSLPRTPSAPAASPPAADGAGRRHTSALSTAARATPPAPAARGARPMPTPKPVVRPAAVTAAPSPVAAVEPKPVARSAAITAAPSPVAAETDAMSALDALLDDVDATKANEAEGELSDTAPALERLSGIDEF
jgi:hypothetical protein